MAATSSRTELILRGVRQHNLKGFDLAIPHDRLVVVTGVSGSGKSSLAFDTCYAEGQRRYMESLSTYARQFLEKMPRPDVDEVDHLYPAVALAQRNPVRTQRSTVATSTEVHDLLRILWARAGTAHCEGCGKEVRPFRLEAQVESLVREHQGRRAYVLFPVWRRKGERKEAWAGRMQREGFLRLRVGERTLRLDEDDLPHAARLDESFVVADRLALQEEDAPRLSEALETALRHGHGRARIEVVDGPAIPLVQQPRCPWCDHPMPDMEPHLFSFNSPLGACESCKGFGEVLEYSRQLVIPDENLSLAEGAVVPWQTAHKARWQQRLEDKAEELGVDLDLPWKDLPEESRRKVWEGEGRYPGVLGFFRRLEKKKYRVGTRILLRRYQENRLCPECRGARLQPAARSVLLDGLGIHEVTALSILEACRWADALELEAGRAEACEEALRQLRERLGALRRVGLGYVTLDRAVKTLSSGEHQRMCLAHQLGSTLTGTLYVLDEPTVGLHARDTDRLLAILADISRRGNTVMVVEHDPAVIRSADHVIELGPGAGEEGGRLLFSGPRETFLNGGAPASSRTSGYLRGDWTIPLPEERRLPRKGTLQLTGCTGNNLKGVDLEIPLGLFVAVSGVSGSGKTTLIRHTLHAALARRLKGSGPSPEPYDSLSGAHRIADVVLLDQEPIGKSPRSNPATYLKVMDEIRKVFAGLPSSRREGLTAGHFSFNAGKGRCPVCKGEGQVTVEMHFLEDLHLTCEECGGSRYRQKVLRSRYKGRSIADVLDTTVDEAAELFAHQKGVLRKLKPLQDVGLGYLRLGQPAPTLSGGESQRLKVAGVLAGGRRGHTLFLLDEPTSGLHPWDVRILLEVLNRLVREGHTVLVVEHNLEVLAAADWLVDLGPEGGDSGGRIVAAGTPEDVADTEESLTGRYLSELL